MTSQRTIRGFVPWLILLPVLAAPLFVVRESWLLAYLAQTATMIVFALSYNLLLGETGLLSFGHAAYAGLAAFAAAHLFNRGGVPLPLLPLVGGAAGACAGSVFGFVATRRAGTAFAMITLGIGELAAAAAWTLPEGFGGAAGIAIDRASGPSWGALSFGPAREAYGVVALWCLLASAAMIALTRTPFARLANAVRDNAMRVASLGTDPRRIRYAMFVAASFFAGVAGALSLINVELASAEGVGMARSGAVLIATVIGGSATFFGPVLGAFVLTFFSVALATVTRAWPLYLGLVFIAVVMRAPGGLAGALERHAAHCARGTWPALAREYALRALAALAWLVALVIAVESVYARALAVEGGGVWRVGALAFDAAAPSTWVAVVGFAAAGALAAFGVSRIVGRGRGRDREDGR
ncbi:branched-chain amino acid ABC transporter permease [Trinickia fusca]|uniref:Branched-chain amino acid ABC transporter permease n=1 Tax=Trinickia fusca TaxID=2419777 RepID=A0A494XNJ8_9BURK|nr:branched-chain amino acid ABC transporter permease [Trinickia fusca]RKP52198.1 branched-chain amino acid ABC transporter permease [Trinickia fusca]